MLQDIQRSLTMIACSENEFTPYQDNRSSAWRGVAIVGFFLLARAEQHLLSYVRTQLYHYAQMASRIPIPTLLALAGKESAREAAEAQKAVSKKTSAYILRVFTD